MGRVEVTGLSGTSLETVLRFGNTFTFTFIFYMMPFSLYMCTILLRVCLQFVEPCDVLQIPHSSGMELIRAKL